MDQVTGGCLCGKMRYTIEGEPMFVSQCCCKDCQKATGTGHTTIIGIHKDQLKLEGESHIPHRLVSLDDLDARQVSDRVRILGARQASHGDPTWLAGMRRNSVGCSVVLLPVSAW